MNYISTRGKSFSKSSYDTIFKGLAEDGGLFVLENMPILDWEEFLSEDFGYDEVSAMVIQQFFQDIPYEEILDMTKKAYNEKFFVKNALKIQKVGDISVMELFHGPTSAFKDFALSMLPQFMEKPRGDKKVIILTATSGDTGKAALEGFKDIEGIDVVVFYPTDGVSSMQKLQMMTQEGKNVHVFAVNGNFDDAQRGVKEIFQNKEMEKWMDDRGYVLSSANSINIGRLIPQVAYYVYSYIELVRKGTIASGDFIDIVVPTGNFGNILAAYYAKEMGIPIGNFICASNENNVLSDFFQKGTYDANRSLVKTTSPSMDILVSSNLERFLYEITKDSERVAKWMEDLKENGMYSVGEEFRKEMKDFYGYYATVEESQEGIREFYEKYQYVMDPHTAVAYKCWEKFKEENKGNYPLIVSTASPYKFPEAVTEALEIHGEESHLLEEMEKKTGVEIPVPLEGLKDRKILHNRIIEKEDMGKVIQEEFYGSN